MTDFKKWAIFQSSLLGGAILLISILIMLLGFDINSRTSNILEERKEILSRSTIAESLALLKSDAEKASPYTSILENTLPTKDQLIVFSRELDSLAKGRRLSFGFNFGKETASTVSEPGFNDFKAVISGPYAELVNFLKDIKKSRYLVKFTNVDIVENGKDFEMSVVGSVFFR